MELVMVLIGEKETPCRSIRCREIGCQPSSEKAPDDAEIELKETVYGASGGEEHFLSFEAQGSDALIG